MAAKLFDDRLEAGSIEQAVCAHVSRYRLTIVQAIKHLFFPGSSGGEASAVLEKLAAEGRIAKVKGRSAFARSAYYAPGYKVRADPDLARIWFCCLGKKRRFLTTFDETRDLFAAEKLPHPFHNLQHCVEESEGGPALLRIYWCVAEKKNAKEQLKNAVGKSAKRFSRWVSEGSYGVAVVVGSDAKRREVEKLLSTSFAGRPPLSEQARYVVEVVPTVDTFASAVASLEGEQSS